MTALKWIPVLFLFAIALGAAQFSTSTAHAQSSFFTSRGCVNCHDTSPATCNGCHHHGNSNLKAATNKTTYAPGETVTATLSGGSRTGWVRAVLYDQNNVQLAISSGNDSGMGSSTTLPATLTAPAPSAPGTYTWKMAYFGNQDGTGTGDVHGEKVVTANSFTVAAATDTTAPVVTFTLPATATSLTVPVSSFTATDNVAVTGYMINKVATPPAASASGWSGSAPGSVTAVAGSNTFYAWAKDAAGNISAVKSATVAVTLPTVDTTPPTLTVSTLADGSLTNKATLNVSGSASDAGGLQSVTVNGQAVTVTGGSFSSALNLVAGANIITVVAADQAGNQATDSRTITYDPAAPVLTVTAPADNSTTTQSFVTVTGTVNETSTVTVTDNSGSPQSAAIDGNSFTATVNLVSGLNTIDITATDLAGNTANAKRTVTFNAGILSLAVTDPAQDITTSQADYIIQGTVTGAQTPVTVTITVDGQTYTPPVTNGSFTQAITFTTPNTYAVTVTAADEVGNQSSVQRNIIFAKAAGGDLDGDSTVTIADALMSLKLAVGMMPMNPAYLAQGDIAPYVNGQSQPDGKIDISDALLILKICVGAPL